MTILLVRLNADGTLTVATSGVHSVTSSVPLAPDKWNLIEIVNGEPRINSEVPDGYQ